MLRPVLLVVCGTLLAAAAAARAQTTMQAPDSQGVTGLGAAIDASYYQTQFKYDRGTYDTDLTEVGLALGEHFTQAFSMFFEGGYAKLSQSGNPVTSQFTPSGYYARIGANYHLPLISRRFGLDFDATADYHRVKDSNRNAEVTDHWTGFSGSVGPWVRLGSVALEAGLVYRHATGTEERQGKNAQSMTFHYARSTNPYFDLSYHVEPDATVGLHVEGGAWKGATLTFAYNFSSL